MTDVPLEASAETTPGSRAGERRDPASKVIVACGIVMIGGLAAYLQRGFSFVADEWDALAHYVDGGLLTPYNGHLSIVPMAIYQGLARVFGLSSYRPFGVVGLLTFLAIPVALFTTHRRRVDALLCALAALGIAWSSNASMNMLYGFLVNFNLPIVALLIAWWAIREATPRGDIIAVVAVVLALASSSIGIIVAGAIVVELVITRVPMRRLLTFVPPIGAWFIWWLVERTPATSATFAERASYAWHLLVAILAGFTAGWAPGAALVGILVVAIIRHAHRSWDAVDGHVIAIGIALVSFIVVTAYTRAGDIVLNPPDSSRYVFFGDLLIVAALLWCWRDRRADWRVLAPVALVVVSGAVPLVGHLRDWRTYVITDTARTRPYLLEAEAAGPRADRSRILPLNMIPVTVGDYLDLVDRLGSPVSGNGDDLGSEASRIAADQLAITDSGLMTTHTTSPRCPSRWQAIERRPSDASVNLEPGSSLRVSAVAPVEIRIRRLATNFPATPQFTIHPGDVRVLTPPVDPSPLRWQVLVSGQADLAHCEH